MVPDRERDITRAYRSAHRRSLPLIAYLAILVVIFMTVAAAGATYAHSQAQSQAQHDAAADANFAAASAATAISTSLTVLQSAVAKLAATPGIGAVLTSPGGCSLTFAGSGDFTTGHIDITRADGAAVCTSLSARPDGYRDMPWLAQALAAPVLIGPVVDPATGQASIVAASPIAGAGGVAAGWVSLEPVGPAIAGRLGGPRHLEFLLTNQDGSTALARSIQPTRWIGAPLVGTPFARSTSLDRPDVDGRARIYGKARVARLGWVVYAGADQAATVAEADAAFNRELAIVLVGLAVMLLATVLVYRQMTRPIRQMSQAIRLAQERGFAGPIHVQGATEVMILANDYNALVAAVQHELARRQQIEDEIQDQVTARTLELRTANAELAEATRHKSQFLANMSHELRTPLNAILGFTELLIDRPRGTYDQKTRQRFLRMVNDSGHQLLALINDILDLSKVEAGQMDLRLESVEIAQVTDRALETVAPLAAAKEIDLQQDVDAAARVEADSGKVRQMLLNLLSNAIKFTPEHGKIVVSGHQRRGQIELSVTDSGVGIAPADRERIFDEFHQIDSGHSRGQQGTGLGLALTKRFAELHGGTVSVESEVGKGSRFVIRLPLRAISEQTAPRFGGQDVGTHTDGGGLPLVLVVEDHAATAQLICSQLQIGGYRTEVARDAQQAIEMARDLQPVAVTLDILLPGIDGWEVLRVLKNDELTRELPVIVVSVVDNEALGRALGAVDYFVKPVDSRTLLARLESLNLAPSVVGRKAKVLVIDDEPAAIDLIEAMLRPLGFTVIRAEGGTEGIDLARSTLPDLVLTDLQMPGVSGFEVVSALRADPTTHEIPTLVLTSKELTSEDKDLLNHGVEAVLRKGSQASVDLVSWVNEVTNRIEPPEEVAP